jgi:hypothetical protein
LTIFGLKFDPCGPKVLNIKILKPYFTSTYSVWQYGIEIKCIKWKRNLGQEHKLTIFYPKFDPCGSLFLKVKILKPYCASTYSVWQYCIEIKCIKWKRILDHKHKLSIFSPKFDPCGPLFLKIKILKLYCALSTYSTVEFTSQLKCDRQTEGQGWKQYPVFFLKVRGYIWRLSFNTVKTITKHRSEIILLIHKILQTCSLFLQITHERMIIIQTFL